MKTADGTRDGVAMRRYRIEGPPFGDHGVTVWVDAAKHHVVDIESPLRVSGTPQVNLVASTSGTDSDWVVKLIDVFPPEVRSNPTLGGYQLMVSADIMRGRYRESLETPKAITPGEVAPYRVRLPEANHTFLPGHRVMVQVQSSWFPLYDRNPQTFVENIGKAKPTDYRTATQRIWFAPDKASFVEMQAVKR